MIDFVVIVRRRLFVGRLLHKSYECIANGRKFLSTADHIIVNSSELGNEGRDSFLWPNQLAEISILNLNPEWVQNLPQSQLFH